MPQMCIYDKIEIVETELVELYKEKDDQTLLLEVVTQKWEKDEIKEYLCDIKKNIAKLKNRKNTLIKKLR